MNNPNPQNRPSPGVASAVSQTLAAATPIPTDAPREEDPRTRAARRAQELREHMGGSMDDGTDKYYIDPAIIPDGWSYEWKTFTVLGKENPSYQVSLAHRGWEAVPRTRHPELMPDNYRGETIERDGMILMERPKEITDEVKSLELRKARTQVRDKEVQLGAAPPGQFERGTHPNTQPKINKTFEQMQIPEK